LLCVISSELIAGDHYLQLPKDARESVAGRIDDWLAARL
jgi:hypothetical protein